MTSTVKGRFVTAEHERTLVPEWDNLTLNSVMANPVGKSQNDCLEVVVRRMNAIQSGLTHPYRNDDIFKNKPLNTKKDIPASSLAFFKPAATVEVLMSDLHSSLPVSTTDTSDVAVSAHFVDLKY